MSLQWINNKMSNLYAISPLVFLIAFMTMGNSSTPKIDVAKMSSEAIFRNIFFGEGELAEKIPQLKELNIRNFTTDQRQIEEGLKFQDEITRAIAKKYPDYMPMLKEAVVSGDRNKISKAIIQGAKYLDDVVWKLGHGLDREVRADLTRELSSKVNKKGTPDVKKVVNDYVEQTAGDSYASKEACVLVLVVAVAVAVAIALWVVYTVELAEAESVLAHEQIVDSIAGY